MLVKLDERITTDRMGRSRRAKICVFKCDHCDSQFERKYQIAHLRTLHLCSVNCRTQATKVGGAIQKKQRQTLLSHYGVDHPQKSARVRDKTKRTVLERYGVTNALLLGSPNSIEACEKRHETMKKTGGYVKASKKCHETMKKNGTYGRLSKQETMLYDLLVEKFGENDVKRQVLVNDRWPIDFYVRSIDTYIQYDSEYWHGLDRPIDVIMTSQNPRDGGIYRNWLSDRAKDKWFSVQKLNLIRIVHGRTKTDLESLRAKLETILKAKAR